MGHINQKIFNKLLKTVTDVEYSRKNSQAEHICEICAEVNLISKIKKFSNDQINIYLKSVFSDICDSISLIIFFKKIYFITFVNQMTKYLEIHFLDIKNNVI